MKVTRNEKKAIIENLSWIIDDNFDAMMIITDIYRRGKELEESLNIDASLYFANNVEILDFFNIRGRALKIFYEHLCDGDIVKYDTSIYVLDHDVYSKDEVELNLLSKFPIPFVFEDMKDFNDVELFEYFQRQKEMHLEKRANVNPNLVLRFK